MYPEDACKPNRSHEQPRQTDLNTTHFLSNSRPEGLRFGISRLPTLEHDVVARAPVQLNPTTAY